MASARSSRSISARCPVKGARSGKTSAPFSNSATDAASVRALRTAARSRGPPRSSARRDRARSISGTRRKDRRRSSRKPVCSSKNRSRACRAAISSRSRDGLDNRRSNNRPPAAVTVRSIAANSDPSRPPVWLMVNSRLRRVAASICMPPSARSRTGTRSSGSLPRWVRSR